MIFMEDKNKKELSQDGVIPQFITKREEEYLDEAKNRGYLILLLILVIGYFLFFIFTEHSGDVKKEVIISLIIAAVMIVPYLSFFGYYRFVWKRRLKAEKDGRCIDGQVARIEEQFGSKDSILYWVHVEYDDFGKKKKWTSPRYVQNPALYLTEGGKCRLLKHGWGKYLDRNFKSVIEPDNAIMPIKKTMTLEEFHRRNPFVLMKRYVLVLPIFLIPVTILIVAACLVVWNSLNSIIFLVFGIILGAICLAAGIGWPVYSFIKLKKANKW